MVHNPCQEYGVLDTSNEFHHWDLDECGGTGEERDFWCYFRELEQKGVEGPVGP